jgi:PAS domain S-box-containing protein
VRKKSNLIEYLAIAQLAHDCSTFEEAAEIILTACKNVINADSGYIALLSDNGNENEIVYLDSGGRQCNVDPESPMPIRGLRKKCCELKKPVYDNGYSESEWKSLLPDGHVNLDNVLFAPIIHNKDLIGLLGLADKSSGFDDEDVELSSLFAKTASVALNNLRDRESLLQSDIKYRKLIDNLPVGLYVTDSMEQIVEMNKKMLELLGIEKPEDFQGEDILKYYLNPQDRIEWQKQLENNGSVNYLETQFKGKNDQVIWISENANIIEGPEGEQYCEVSIEDITTRKVSEEAFLKTFLKLNETHKQLNDKAAWMEKLNSFLIEIVSVSDQRDFHFKFLRQLNEYIESKYMFVGFFKENTDDLHLEGFWEGKEFDETIGIKSDDFSLMNSDTHDVKILNSSNSRLKNIQTEFSSFLKNQINENKNDVILLPLEKNKKLIGNIILTIGRDKLNDNLLYFLKSTAEFFSIININISLLTEVKNSYLQLKKAQDTMKKQERIKAMGQIASGITHDINNTLAPITLYTEALVETEEGLSNRAVKYLKTIQNAVADIENVTQRLRTFYKHSDEQNREPIKIDELFDEVIELTRPKWKNIPNKKGISVIITKDVKDKSASFIGVRSDIREALMNCIFNSVDALPDGGDITLGAESVDEKLLVRISDTGIGMEAEQLNHCLEPFFTTKGASGSGLGLAEVYGMIQRHDGEMKVESSKDQGTSISLYFNSDLSRESESEISTDLESRKNIRNLKIMCVDDDLRILEGLKDMFSIDSHEVITSESGLQALHELKIMKEKEFLPDVIFTDLGMPGMDGYELASEIKHDYPDIPIILLSGWGHQINASDNQLDDFFCVISKPPRIKKLREVLVRISDGGEGNAN